MTSNMLVAWLVVGLVAGLLAAGLVRGGGFGVFGDLVLGIAGAFVGGWAFHSFGWHVPFSGLGSAIFVASVGALILLVVANMIRFATLRTHRI